MSFKSFVKGWIGEAMGSMAHKLLLDAKDYIDLGSVTIPALNGTTQIDHVIVSRYGIFVIETKNMDGWIFGDAKSPLWTQGVFGKKYRFQNPLHQNYRHTKALQEFLGVDETKLIPFVMFWGECEFKTVMPRNVLAGGYISFIKSHTVVVFSDDEVQEMVEAVRTGRMPKGILKSVQTHHQHLESLRDRHSSATVCPKCGKALVQRTAKTGKNAGSQFYGCSGFPACRYVKPD